MSTPGQGQGLPFSIVFGRKSVHSVSVAAFPALECANDEDVMARLHSHESDALNVLFDRYSRLVLGIALRILHDYGEAEDIVQEVFFQVFQKAQLFDRSKGTAKA